jgi:2-dehydro-3-deoxygluconokinase
VAVSLAHFGLEAFAVSKVPDHEIGQACINALRRFGVNTAHIARGGDRLGVLYLEQGAAQRPAKVIYDRAGSSFRHLRADDLDWHAILKDKDWLHFSGTAPASGPAVVEVLKAGLATARRLGVTVSCDCNYRSKLWSLPEAGRVLPPLLEHVQVLICGPDDPWKIFGVGPERVDPSDDTCHQRAAELLRERFNLDAVAMTFRDGVSASVNRYSALLCRPDGTCRSRQHEVQIVDRIGTGDAFAAGLIFALVSGFEPQRAIEFAAAAACLKHSIPGDFNLASREEVEQLLAGNRPGGVQR